MDDKSTEDLPTAWRLLNEAPGRPWLIWQLTNRGVGSEVLVMVMAMLHALENGLAFRLASRGSNLAVRRGWSDWFEPFCPAYDPLVLRRGWVRKSNHPLARLLIRAAKAGWLGPRNSRLTHDVFQEVWNERLNERRFRIPELGIDGDLSRAASVLLKMVWRLQPEVKSAIEDMLGPLNLDRQAYAAIHIRRGDKRKEAVPRDPIDYIAMLEQHRPDLKTVFVATDDYSITGELSRLRPAWRWISLAKQNRTGHLQRHFNRRPAAARRQDTHEILADIEALRRSAFFIGTWSSNFGRLVALLKELESCAGIDGDFQVIYRRQSSSEPAETKTMAARRHTHPQSA